MLDGFIKIHHFNENELIFDEAETKEILKFFFRSFLQRIEVAAVTTDLRNFVQWLLIEAIDATHALGYIEILFKTYYNPGSGMKKVLSKAVRKSAQHWFKHANQRGSLNAKISSRIRDQLALNFKTHFSLLLDEIASATQRRKTHMAYVRYSRQSKPEVLWG